MHIFIKTVKKEVRQRYVMLVASFLQGHTSRMLEICYCYDIVIYSAASKAARRSAMRKSFFKLMLMGHWTMC